MSEGPDETQETLVGRRPAPLTRTQLVCYLVYLGCAIGYAIVRDRFELIVFVVVFSLYPAVQLRQPSTVVNRAGIRRPWRRPAIVYWPEVASVAAPQPGNAEVRLTLTTGKTVGLQGIWATHSAQVAALGGKELLAPPPVRMPPRALGVRSDIEITADVERRAKALSDEWRRLDQQSPHRP